MAGERRFVLNEAVNIAVTSIIPYVLSGNVHGIAVRTLLIVSIGMGFVVTSTCRVTTD